ncbi:hypothetical protein ABEB36_000290 [Hypothenemus hampei]|uniref:Uncharacterized protein n=1 Tax=Hypothenemus hampei TaxID=57062 RepID=A0ABD1FDX8_HYPHA
MSSQEQKEEKIIIGCRWCHSSFLQSTKRLRKRKREKKMLFVLLGFVLSSVLLGFVYSLGWIRRVPDEWYDSDESMDESTDTEEDEPGPAADISEEQRLAGIICIVRSILVSTRAVLTVAEFRREYTELVWGELPHLEFGFSSLIQFLYTLRDVCYLVVSLRGYDGVSFT